jgi:HD-GYP domain-containing protein (c-di-GMP phosphodiesterase class II)
MPIIHSLHDTVSEFIHCLIATIDARDSYTAGHSERVARIALRLGRQMNLSEKLLGELYLAGLLHDIGKIGLRDTVLLKCGPLTGEESQHVKEHPVIGDRLLQRVRHLAHLRPGVRHHHERYDGLGYPDRLAGFAIPLQARILAVADSCDAMMTDRPYRKALTPAQIEEALCAGAGTQWDPILITHFWDCREDVHAIVAQGLGESVHSAVGRLLQATAPAHHLLRTRRRSQRVRLDVAARVS